MNWVDERFVFFEPQAKSDSEVIRILARALQEAGFVKESFEEAVLQREQEFPTGLPTPEFGVAIPHTDPEHVLHPTIAVAILKTPITFKEMGNPDSSVAVNLVCLLALEGTDYVTLLSQFVEAIQEKEFLHKVCTSQDAKEIALLFNSKLNFEPKEVTK